MTILVSNASFRSVFQTFYQHLPDFFWAYEIPADDTGRFAYLGPALRAHWPGVGKTLDELKQRLQGLVPEDNLKQIEQQVALPREDEDTQSWWQEFLLTLPDGLSRRYRLYAEDSELPGRSGRLLSGFIYDPQDLHSSAEDIQDTLYYLQAVLDYTDQAVITTNSHGMILALNRSAERMFELSAQDMLTHPISRVIPHLHDHGRLESMSTPTEDAGETEDQGPYEVMALRQFENVFSAEIRVAAFKIRGECYFVTLLRDLTEHQQKNRKIESLSFYDQLTGLPNRRKLRQTVQDLLTTTAHQGHCAAAFFIDIDHFKAINDSAGHSTGDLFLQQVASRLKQINPKPDIISRVGGDEFFVFSPNIGHSVQKAKVSAAKRAQAMIEVLSAPFDFAGESYICGASVGLTLIPAGEGNFSEILRHVDIAMYDAKERGRNQYSFFDQKSEKSLTERRKLQRDLWSAIHKNGLEMYYQPQVDDRGRVVGVESLIRWNRAHKGFIPPDVFIPIAESGDQILHLGAWVFEQVCLQSARWRERYGDKTPVVSVNISPREFRQSGFVERVTNTLMKTGASPQDIRIEITEGVLVDQPEEARRKMIALKALGLSFSLDDFGSGYSSLIYLKRLPIDEIKIDRSFVSELATNSRDEAIVNSILGLGRNMLISVIAEGVESQQQVQILKKHGCRRFQGFLYGRPTTAVNVQKLMDRHFRP